jgi:HK97 family phage major capsid protein
VNEYLKKLRERYAAMQKSVNDVQVRCAAESRDMTDAESALVRGQIEAMNPLADEIKLLTDQANREADVADMAAELEQRAAKTSNTTAEDRDPGHYRSADEGGQHSFFADMVNARENDDQDAKRRLNEHSRALTSGGEGVGLVAPKWLTELYNPINRQGRRLADAVRNIPLGNDPRPITVPKQTVGTDAEITEQASENDPIEDDDSFDTDVDTITPKATAGSQIVSRQMIDMASPAIDQLIYGDMIAAYDLKLEKKIGAAMIAAGTVVSTAATNAAFNAASWFLDAVIDAEIAMLEGRKLPADIIAMGNVRYGMVLKLKDTTGRPLVSAINPQNAFGSGNAAAGNVREGNIEGLRAFPTEGVSVGAFPDNVVVARSEDTILFEGNMMRFKYEQPLGPESIKMGIWAYTAVWVRNAQSVKLIRITAAS